MHKSHQARLTSITNQLKQQHAEQMEALTAKYEQQLKELRQTGSNKTDAQDDAAEKQRQELEEKIEAMKEEAKRITATYEEKIKKLSDDHEKQIEEIGKRHKKQVEEIAASLRVCVPCYHWD